MNSPVLNFTAVLQRISNAFEKCKFILKFTKSTATSKTCKLRKNFPRSEAVIFSRDLSEMVDTLNQIMGHDFLIAKQLCSSMICIASQLSNGKENGIEAFANLISALQWTIQTIIAQRQEILSILEENLELRKTIEKLEEDLFMSNDQVDQDLREYKSVNFELSELSRGASISELKATSKIDMHDDASEEPTDLGLLNISESDDLYTGKPSNDDEYIYIKRVDLLREIEKAILRTMQSKFEVLDVYIGVSSPPADPEERLVVIYDCNAINQDSDASSIESQFVSWFPTSRRTSNYYCNYIDEENWSQFRQEQQPEFRTLLTDFFDSACVDLLKTHSDVVAVFPSVHRVLNEGPFDPVLCIVKKSLRFHPFEDKKSIPLEDKEGGLYMTLHSGKQIKVVVKEGWISAPSMMKGSTNEKSNAQQFQGPPINALATLSMGDGISLTGLDESYGTIGGFVKKNGTLYAVTNQHVVMKAMNERVVMTFMDPALEFVTPSIGAKAMKLQRDTKNQTTATTASGGGLFSFLMREHDNSSLKGILCSSFQAPAIGTQNPKINLTEVRTFLYSNQSYFSVNYDDVMFFDVDITDATVTSSLSIPISADLALIPMPSNLKESGKTVTMLYLKDIIKNWENNINNLKVNKVGATTGETQGEITRPVNIKHPIPPNEMFQDKYNSKPLKNRILKNQIIVRGSGFGDFGDSGSLVYFDPTTINKPSSKLYAVGTFVGKLDRANDLFIVTPSCDFFEREGYDFVGTSASATQTALPAAGIKSSTCGFQI